IYFSSLKSNGERMILAATEKGLCWAGGFNETEEDMKTWLLKQNPNQSFERNEKKLQYYKRAFENYFSGEKKMLDVPLDLKGTAFQLAVWEALQHIPYGETRTYSEIAEAIGNPKSIR